MAVFELAQLKMIRMIIDDQCDVKNVFEPADWLKDPFDVTFDPDWVAPGSTPGNYYSYQFLIEPIQKPPLVPFHCKTEIGKAYF